jgi:hypothetical protein
MNFLKTFGAWSLFACSPPLMLALVAAPSKTVDVRAGVLFSLPFLLIPAVGSILLWLPSLRLDTTRKALLAGISFGLFAPFLLGFVYMEIYPGFENRVGIFAGALFTAGFSAAGGGVAGWLRSPPKRERGKTSVRPV